MRNFFFKWRPIANCAYCVSLFVYQMACRGSLRCNVRLFCAKTTGILLLSTVCFWHHCIRTQVQHGIILQCRSTPSMQSSSHEHHVFVPEWRIENEIILQCRSTLSVKSSYHHIFRSTIQGEFIDCSYPYWCSLYCRIKYHHITLDL